MPSFAEQMKQYFKQNGKSKEHSAHSAKVHSVAWSEDGRKLASGSYDQTASVFILDRDRLVSFLYITIARCLLLFLKLALQTNHITRCPNKLK